MENNNKAVINEVENESKSMLTKGEFETLRDYFLLTPASFVQQINKYFADKDGVLRTVLPPGTTLRLRHRKQLYELQFKVPQPNGENSEYEDVFAEDNDAKYDSLFEKGSVFEGNVRKALIEHKINADAVEYLGDATTYRYKVLPSTLSSLNSVWEKAIVYLDHTVYPRRHEDYELEIETDDLAKSEATLLGILHLYKMEKVPGMRKIERFYKYAGI